MADKMNELVSIIITTYKRPWSQIQRAIDSAIHQTYNLTEIIVVDDSPTSFSGRDEVRDHCLKLKSHNLKYIQHEVNKGACAARNTGIENSKGYFVSFLDDDDEYLPDRIEKMLSKFTEDVSLVYCNANIYNIDSKKIVGDFFKNSKQYKGFVYEQIMRCNFIGSTSFVMAKRQSLIEAGWFDTNLPASQDWDMWIRLCKDNKVDFVEYKLVNYYIYNGIRITNDCEKRLKALYTLEDKDIDFLDKNRSVYADRVKFITRIHIMNGDFKSAIKSYLRMWRIYPCGVLSNLISLKSFMRFLISNRD